MTKKKPNCHQTTKIKIRKTKRIRHKFIKRHPNNKKNYAQTITTNDTQKNKYIIKNNQEQVNLNIHLIQENNNKYSINLLKNYLQTYGEDILTGPFINESNLNKKIITAKILNKYNITEEHRKCAFKYLLKCVNFQKINIKCYFSATLIFDLFLNNYSKDELNNNCETFFISKKTNTISETKVILFLLCCLHLTTKYYNTKKITLEQLLEFENVKEEFTYNQLNNLIQDIILYINVNVGDINIYYFIKIYMFDILEHFKILTKNQKFLEEFQYYTYYFSTKIIQDINTLNISDNIQAIGIVLFSFNLSKYTSGETNDNLDNYLNKWTEKVSKLINNYDINGLKKIINWLQIYVSR